MDIFSGNRVFRVFLTAFSPGNQFAIYSEASLPEIRSTANAISGLMVNLEGIIGKLLISSLIERNISLLPFSVFLVLIIWLIGSFFWILTYFYYPIELKKCGDTLLKRRLDLENEC